jgi:hypothetical protein
MSNHENYGHFEVRQPIGLVRSENGEVSVPSKFGRRPMEFKPLGNVGAVVRPTRVSSSTTPSRRGDSETQSNDAQTVYGAADVQMSGQERHFMSMLESSDITAAEADSYFDSYFS